ncbi:MAG: serine protease [Candidatus Brocadiaceae bacterium]|nr:serine protease [Candidatus Brocadiaceae bacterium]
MRRRLPRALAACAALLAAMAARGAAQDPRAALERAAPVVACVRSTLSLPEESPPAGEAHFSNAGFFVGTQGEMLTSLLGLAGCREIRVFCPDGRQSEATVAALDQASGLALLRTELRDTAPFAPAPALPSPGAWALVASVRQRADGLSTVLSPGLVTRHNADVRIHGVAWDGMLGLAGHVWSGCAGAPVLDMEGRLAGVVLAVTYEAAREPEVLVLPEGDLAPILARLKQGETRRLGWLGITLTGEPGAREGARIRSVLKDSPAQRARLHADDIILQIGPHVVDDPAVVARHVVEAGPGRTVELKVLRGDAILTIPVALEARPLLVSGGMRQPPPDRIRPWPTLDGMPLAPEFADLVRENQRLQERLRELERQVQAPALQRR